MTCESKIWHGPGHQSSTNCQLTGEHEVHVAIYGSMNLEAEWTGGDVFSGFFDEPPREPYSRPLTNAEKLEKYRGKGPHAKYGLDNASAIRVVEYHMDERLGGTLSERTLEHDPQLRAAIEKVVVLAKKGLKNETQPNQA